MHRLPIKVKSPSTCNECTNLSRPSRNGPYSASSSPKSQLLLPVSARNLSHAAVTNSSESIGIKVTPIRRYEVGCKVVVSSQRDTWNHRINAVERIELELPEPQASTSTKQSSLPNDAAATFIALRILIGIGLQNAATLSEERTSAGTEKADERPLMGCCRPFLT